MIGISEHRFMAGDALPATLAIYVDIGESDYGHDLALRIQGCRQSADVPEIALHMRLHF